MFEREIMIAGLRKEQNTLRELIEGLEDNAHMGGIDLEYCREVLKKVEKSLKRLKYSCCNQVKCAF